MELVISTVIIKVTMVITPIRELITPFITTHEPPSSSVWGFRISKSVIMLALNPNGSFRK